MVEHMPEVWFSGNRYMKSDKGFITDQLLRLSPVKQKEASDQYRELYLKDYPAGRRKANEFLFAFCNDNGLSMNTMRQVRDERNKREESSSWFHKRIKELREAQEKSRKRITV